MLSQSRNFWRQCVLSLFSRASANSRRQVKRQRQTARVAVAEVLEGRALLSISGFAGPTGVTYTAQDPAALVTTTTSNTTATPSGSVRATWSQLADIYTASGGGSAGFIEVRITAGGVVGDSLGLRNSVTSVHSSTAGSGGGATTLTNISTTVTAAFNTGSTTAGTISYSGTTIGDFTLTNQGLATTTARINWAIGTTPPWTTGRVVATWITAQGLTTTTQNQNHAWNHLGNAVLKLFTFSTSAGTAGTRTFKYDIGDTNGNINGSSTATQAMTVNGNAAPTDITLTPATVAENLAAGTVVGTLAAVDTSTVGETATFTLVANANASLSADNSKFQIPVGSNQLQLAQALNFEAQSSYNITVRVTDSAGNPFTKALVVTATNVNEAPTAVALSNSSVAENAAIGTVVGTITGTDPDAGTNLSFTVEGTDLNRFEAFNDAGTWQLRTKEVFNFETDGPFSIAIRGSDGSLSFSQPFTIGVTNVNEAPTTISLNPTSLNENNVSNDVVGELNTDDADLPGTAQTFTYTIVGGDAGFNVWTDPVDGKQKLRTTNLFNYEAKSSYSVQLRSEDQGNLSTATQTFTILVTDVDEAPAWTVTAAQSVNENSQFVATLSATDAEGSAVVYSIRPDAGTDFSKFELRTNTGTGAIELWFTDGNAPDSEAPADGGGNNVYDVHIDALDKNNGAGALATKQEFSVAVTNLNDNAPAFTTVSPVGAPEEQTSVTTLAATDADGVSNAFSGTFSIVGGADADKFNLTSAGVLTFKTAPNADDVAGVPSQTAFYVNVRANDGLNTTDLALQVNLLDINEFGIVISDPVESSGQNAPISVNENVKTVYTVRAKDGDFSGGSTIRFALQNGQDSNLFSIDPVTGVLSWIADDGVDYEGTNGNADYSIQVRAFDLNGNNADDLVNIRVTVVNVPDNAPVISNATTNINYDENNNVDVTNIALTDLDFGTGATPPTGAYSLSVVGGADGAYFDIGDNANLIFKQSPNFEDPKGTINPSNPNQYEVTVQATDVGGTQSSSTKTFLVTVQNVNEAPTDILIGGDSTGNLDENLPAGTLVGLLAPVDPDAGDTHSYAFLDTNTGNPATSFPDNDQFEIVDGNKLQTKASFNHESKASYLIKIRVTDGSGLTYDHLLGISVNDLPEGPVPQTPVAVSFPERETGVVATVDTGSLGFAGPYTFEIISIAGDDSGLGAFSVDADGQLILNTAQDFEQKSDTGANGVYVLNIKVTSPTEVTGVYIPYQVEITEANDPFVITSPAKTDPNYVPRSWTEDSGAGAFDPDILLFDEDAVQTPVNNGRIWVQIENWASGDRLILSVNPTDPAYRVRTGEVDQIWVLDDANGNNPVLLGTTADKGSTLGTSVLDLPLTAEATLPLVQKLLRNIQFENTTGGPAYDRTVNIALKVFDTTGMRNDIYYSPLEIKAQPDAPVISAPSNTPTVYTENQAATPVDGTLLLSDPDLPANWSGYVVTATLENPQDGDLLSVSGAVFGAVAANDGTISDGNGNQIGTYEVLAGATQVKLTMTGGTASRLLRLISFRSTGDNPNIIATRSIKILVDDGAASAERTALVDVRRVNDGPVIALGGGTQTFNEDAAAINVLTGLATVSDVDNTNFNDGRLTVTIVNTTNGLATLGIRNEGASPGAGQIGLDGSNLLWGADVIGTVSVRPESLTVSFTSDLATAEVVAAVASNVTLFTQRQFGQADPFQVRFTVFDGELLSPAVDTQVNFVATNDAVQLGTGSMTSASYTEGGAAIRIGSTITVADPDIATAGSLGGRLVTVSLANVTAQDSLGILTQGTGAGQINLSGSDIFAGSIAIGTIVSNSQVDSNLVLQIQLQPGCTQAFLTSLLRSVVLSNTNVNPSTVSRNVTWTVEDDATFGSSSITTRVSIIAVNSASSVITSTEGELPWAQYTENGSVVIVDSGFSISDVDLNSVNSSFNGGALRVRVYQGTSSDRLQIVAGGDITVSGTAVLYKGTQIGTVSGGTGTSALTITLNSLTNSTLVGADAVIALGRAIGYSNTGDNPTALQRWISFDMSDSKVWSPIGIRSVGVTPINDPPVIRLGSPSASFREDAAFILADSAGSITDADNSTFPGGSLTAALTVNGHADDRLGISTTAAITLVDSAVLFNGTAFADFTGGEGTDPLVITFRTGNVATVAAVQALYRALYFTNVNTANPSTAQRTLTFTLLDGPVADLSTGSSVKTKTISVVSVNDAATFAGLSDVTFTVNSTGVLLAANGAVADVDSMDFQGGSLTAAISVNLQTGDTLSLQTLGTDSPTSGLFINTSTKKVLFNGIEFASYSGGTGTTAFSLTFNINANAVNVSAVLKRLIFKTTSSSLLQRKVSLTMRDGDGGTTTADIFVNVTL